MTKTRMLLETGIGTDLQGEDYTKAAIRAIKNAMASGNMAIIELIVDKNQLSTRLHLDDLIKKVTNE